MRDAGSPSVVVRRSRSCRRARSSRTFTLASLKPSAVAVEGVFYLPKPTGAGTDYAAGSKVYWYSGAAVTGVTGVQAGYTVAAVATTDTSVRVLLFPGS